MQEHIKILLAIGLFTMIVWVRVNTIEKENRHCEQTGVQNALVSSTTSSSTVLTDHLLFLSRQCDTNLVLFFGQSILNAFMWSCTFYVVVTVWLNSRDQLDEDERDERQDFDERSTLL